jgi:hypothetical protein
MMLGREKVSFCFCHEPTGATILSSRKTASVNRAITAPMPYWLAPRPSMMLRFASRTACSTRGRT